MPRLIAVTLLLALMLAGCSARTPATPAQPQPQTPQNNTPCAVWDIEPPPNKAVLHVYYHCGDTEKPLALARFVDADGRTLQGALTELLKGPTADERARGFTSWFSEKTATSLLSVKVTASGRAIVDFADFSRVISGASSSAGSAVLQRELGYTIAQFPEVKEIEYRFQGSCDAFGEWQQTGCIVVPAAPYRQ